MPRFAAAVTLTASMMGPGNFKATAGVRKAGVKSSCFPWKLFGNIGGGKFGKHSGCNGKTAFDTFGSTSQSFQMLMIR
jgi:hypothetical protein